MQVSVYMVCDMYTVYWDTVHSEKEVPTIYGSMCSGMYNMMTSKGQ